MGQSSNTTYRSSYTRFRIYQLNSLLVSVDSMSMLPTLTARNSRTALGGNSYLLAAPLVALYHCAFTEFWQLVAY